MWDCYNDRHIDQWNHKENLQTDLYIHGCLIYNRSSAGVQWGKRSFQKALLGQRKALKGKNWYGGLILKLWTSVPQKTLGRYWKTRYRVGKVICITFILHILTKRLHTEHNEKDRQLN